MAITIMADRIGLNEIVRAVSSKHRLTLQESYELVRRIFELIRQSMIHGMSVQLPSFDVFLTGTKPTGMVMNPKTGRKCVYRDERRVPRMKFSYKVLSEDTASEKASVAIIKKGA